MNEEFENKWKGRLDYQGRIEGMEKRMSKLEQDVKGMRQLAMSDSSRLTGILDQFDQKIKLLEDEMELLKQELKDNPAIAL